MKNSLFIIVTSVLFSVHVYAAKPPGSQGGPQGGPPQEAFDACNNIATGNSCTVETPRGTLNGICRQPPHDDKTICVPEDAGQQ